MKGYTMDTLNVKFASKEALDYPESFWKHDVHYITNIKAIPADDDAYNIQVTVKDPDLERAVTLEAIEPLDAEWVEWVASALEYNALHSMGITIENENGVATFEGDFYPA